MLALLHRVTAGLLVGLFIVVAAGCGSGGGGGGGLAGGIGGTGAVAQGAITGFGSIFVNGIEFETDSSSFDVDDDSVATEGDLALGMVVTVIGTINNDGVTGSASSVEYDDEVEGPVGNDPLEDADMITRTFTVSADDNVELSGMQIIGWDAGSKRIRSWTFDSDGGFAQGVWSKSKDRWYVHKKGTTTDGETTTAVNHVTPVDDATFAFQSTQRTLAGQLLSNIDEVLVVRQ